MGDQNQEAIIIAKSPEQQQQAIMEPNNTSILSHATCTTPIYCCCYSNPSMKRRSPPPSSSANATDEDLRACKKLNFREQQYGFTLNGVSTSPTPFHNSSYFMSPLSTSFKDFFPHTTPSPRREETSSNSMRLKRMKECLREMKKCWEEVMKEEEIEEQEYDYNDSEGVEVEGDKELSKDDECGRDAEEAVKVEWVDKCLSICFKCPCSKGYQILLSGNNCYYKLV